MAESTDTQLIDRFRETGEMVHFNELVERHVGKVRAMIYPMVLNDADADDLTQDVFLRVVRSIDRFRKKARFSTWLHRIAMNTTYTFLKCRTRRPTEHYAEPPEQPDATAGPASNMAAEEIDTRLEHALARLSPSLRSAITLTAIQGMSVREAAETDGSLAATMYWRVHQARKILRTELGEYLQS